MPPVKKKTNKNKNKKPAISKNFEVFAPSPTFCPCCAPPPQINLVSIGGDIYMNQTINADLSSVQGDFSLYQRNIMMNACSPRYLMSKYKLYQKDWYWGMSDFLKKYYEYKISNNSNIFAIKGVLHLWALFLKTLCIFSKNKPNLDKVSYGSGQKCSTELKNHSFTSVEAIVVKLQRKMCENQYFPCFEP